MTDPFDTTIPGVSAAADERAVLVRSAEPLSLLSSAVLGGGTTRAHAIVNMHVDKDYDGADPAGDLAAFAEEHGVHGPFVGLMTAADTEHARLAAESLDGLTVAAVVSMGLSNVTCAGVTPPLGAAVPGTINAIVVVDGVLGDAAMVNAVITATEAKTLALAAWNVRTPAGEPASGTSTDSVVIACTGRGQGRHDYAGPATPVGWLVARTVRGVIERLCREKLERDGGRRVGW